MTSGNFYSRLQAGFARRRAHSMLTLPTGARISYAEIDARAGQMAEAFRAAGARPGDRVMAQVDKSSENVAAYLGALYGGFVYAPLNTAYTDKEVAYFLNDAQPSVFLCDPVREAALAPIARKAGVKAVFTLDASGAGTLPAAADGEVADSAVVSRDNEDLAAILYTSGTTGRSKGAMLSHRALASNAVALNALWEFSGRDVLVHALPIFHIHGLFVALHTAMLSGAEILFLPNFDVSEIRRAMVRANVMMGVPTFYNRLLADEGFVRAEAEHMRLFISGSAPLTAETFAAFEMRTGHKILERYGMSEAGMIASNPVRGERVPGTVGFSLPGVDIRITTDDGDALPAGDVGNVEVRGANLFSGYWRMPEKTESEFRSGWFITGDVGALDNDGRLTLSGRAKDLIIAGGYNIYPKEVEDVLNRVSGVIESAVVGAPHADMGEGVIAVLVGANDPAVKKSLAAALESLAKFKRPRKLFWIDALPRNAMGKVQKQALRRRYADAFNQ
ncbi:MAG: AMP-binding protein [Pseudomonadota bacterium]